MMIAATAGFERAHGRRRWFVEDSTLSRLGGRFTVGDLLVICRDHPFLDLSAGEIARLCAIITSSLTQKK